MTDSSAPEKTPKGFTRLKQPEKLGRGRPQTHGIYSNRFTAEEENERSIYEQELIDDLGGYPTTAQRTLIRRAGFLEIKLRRSERATADGHVLPDNWILAWLNSQVRLLCKLGLGRRQQQEGNMTFRDYLKKKNA